MSFARLLKMLKIWGPAVAWGFLIFVGSSLPGAQFSEKSWLDFLLHSLAHFAEFAVFSFLLFRAFDYKKTTPKEFLERFKDIFKTLRFGAKPFLARIFWEVFVPKKILAAITIAILYAATDEIHQYFVPGRICSFWDFLFDSLGAVVGVFLYRIIATFRI